MCQVLHNQPSTNIALAVLIGACAYRTGSGGLVLAAALLQLDLAECGLGRLKLTHFLISGV